MVGGSGSTIRGSESTVGGSGSTIGGSGPTIRGSESTVGGSGSPVKAVSRWAIDTAGSRGVTGDLELGVQGGRQGEQ